MTKLFQKIWGFIKKLLHIGKKIVQEELEETKEQLYARLKEELAEIDKKIETAVDEELERLGQRAKLIHSQLLDMTAEIYDAAQEKLSKEVEELLNTPRPKAPGRDDLKK